MSDGKSISFLIMKGLNARDPRSYSESSAQPINASQSNQMFPKAVKQLFFSDTVKAKPKMLIHTWSLINFKECFPTRVRYLISF